ncbi:HlyD family efflux transporter periplasmic adaptor subunit [Mesorhizobium loti]|uniref:HlyD family efflux transporter periplasmic adaptor subunit n=1 Tax=Mesorhizobium erdmanii TaxID=1777866 RepID=A0A6M7UPQ4_9HYPH|nr:MULTISPECIES: HlyD family efflux transporter periplasmic adaptor subunit [Mesorhizobium]ANN60737.1 hemolysin secretion protein D [Mesorhizobium loti NZP2037]OBP72247.1 hemolysin secretion protein D [Mesorhizobium loti]OBQ62472.1 hemolysin secretion protein D [Mesorhizobium loti]QKC73150.1 HlyD family efflux transporter periplasmic adaptor subunit [Mesorhizobium loti]QKC79145.1 HlyD family efflux transporter periplasmic adaptor subunit [Mesorhizobium erdmanii]
MAIYKVVVLSVVAALLSLPFITISVSVQSAGIIRPTVEKTPLVAPVSGRISRILAAENDLVAQGQEILALDDGVVEEKLRALTGDIRAKSDFARDLETLISSGTQAKDPIRLLTETATAERAHFLNLVRENQYDRGHAAAELQRAKRLLSAAVAPAKAVEEKAFALQNVEIQGEILARRKFAEWNQQLSDVNLRLEELTAALHQLESERDLTLIRAPVSGALEQFSGLTSSSYVQAGQTVAWVSPDGELVAEIFVSPNDIGFVRPGQSVRLQVDAFNYNQWGVIDATVLDVAHDFTLHDGRPAFKVRCALSRRHLALKHGVIGNLKKGMTVRARFLLGDRTVLELLYNEVDDWLNPLLASH